VYWALAMTYEEKNPRTLLFSAFLHSQMPLIILFAGGGKGGCPFPHAEQG
jgi:hypothetical protein